MSNPNKFRVTLNIQKSYNIISAHNYHSTNLDNASILNLDKYLKNNKIKKDTFNHTVYDAFKLFTNDVVTKLSDEIDSNTGDIIKYHIHKSEYKTKIEEIYEVYKTTYIDGFTPTKEKPYPFFMEDLYENRDLPYTIFEEKFGITKKIEDQTDEEFLDTLKNRIDGLDTCKLDPNYSEELKKYFSNEYEKETDSYEKIKTKKLISNKEFDNNIKEDIGNHCKTIDFSPKVAKQIINTKNNIVNTIIKIMNFFKTNEMEEKYAKTFLPSNCWENGELNYNVLKNYIKEGRNYTQYLYGFFSNDELKILYDINLPLYNVGGMLPALDNLNSCHPLVIWSILLNSVYLNCAIYNKTPLCFLRIYLPVLTTPVDRTEISLNNIPKNEDENKQQEIYEIQSHKQLLDLFDGEPESNAQFIGIITIKFVYNKPKFLEGHKAEYRIWYLYIFKNNNKKNSSRKDTMTGIREEYFCVSQELYYINKGGLFKKDNITYYELLLLKKISIEKKIYFYKTKHNPTLLFLSLHSDLDTGEYQILSELKMTKVEFNIHPYINKKTYLTLEYDLKMSGGFKFPKYKINYTNNEKQLYFNKNIISNFILKSKILWLDALNLSFYGNNIENNYISIKRKIFYKTLKYLYNYLLVNYDESTFEKFINYKPINLTKYKPIGFNFYHIHELFYKYNIFKNFNYDTDTILTLGTNISFIETFKFNNYKIKNIKNILTLHQNTYKNDDLEKWNNYIKNVENIYNVENIKFNDSIYNLIYFDFINSNKNNYKIIYYSVNTQYRGISKYENYYNIPNRFVGILFMLKNLKLGGTFIFNINYLEYKFEADMILIISKYFEKYDLFIPEIHNEFKRSGINVIFENFKGIDNNDYLELLKILETIKKLYPEEGKEFNIYDKDIRHELRITKPIENIPSIIPKQIIGFLDTNINDKIYDKIKEFTEEINFKKCIFYQKMINILSSPENIKNMNNTKLPTPEQIMSSIIYCRKYNIPFNDKYTEDKLNNLTSKTILNNMYGLQEPILHKFKTPFQTYIVNKIVLNPKLKSPSSNKSRSSNKSHSIFKTVYSSSSSKLTKTSKTKKSNKHNKHNKHNKQNSIIRNSFFNNLFESTKSHKSHKSLHKSSQTSSKHKRTKHTSLSLFKRTNVSLDKALFNSNNSIVQAGLMIDSRKDFTKANPNEDYEKFRDQFRYYRAKGRGDKQPNLNIMVQNMIGDNNISQAWLKMYEIISECGIVPISKNGTFKSFHFCEAPGTFINCLNNYIATKTKFNNFEWMAQSLHPRLAKIKDAYGIIKRHPKNWDWGVDGTGDITNPDNIRHYAKIIKLFSMASINNMALTGTEPPFLITADAGLEPKDPKYKLVAYSSYVAILYSLPMNGTMVYKIKDLPLDLPLIWNLIYITYTNFKEMYFFKPVQNSQSLEFYIIAKDYLGIDTKILEYLMKQIGKFGKDKDKDKSPDIDLFDDMYPEEFVVQLSNIYEKLANNYINSIERIIYYVDNKDLIGKDYIKHIKGYVEEKNEDWIRKYKIRRLDRNKLL